MKTPYALLSLLLSACLPAHATQWVPLDKVGGESYLLRQGDRDSLKRMGPWAEFSQHWIGVRKGVKSKEPSSTEVMAVNCLTGARFAKSYEHTDPDTDKRVMFTQSLEDIEQSSSPISRIDIVKPKQGLDANLVNFACSCPKPQASKPGDDATLQRLYDSYIKEQTKETEYDVHFMRFSTPEKALAAVRMLDAGASFGAVAAKLKLLPKLETADLGLHPGHDWSRENVKLFRTMKAGEYTRQPVKGIYGYELFLLKGSVEKPAAPFKDWRATIETYARREQSCGRQLLP